MFYLFVYFAFRFAFRSFPFTEITFYGCSIEAWLVSIFHHTFLQQSISIFCNTHEVFSQHPIMVYEGAPLSCLYSAHQLFPRRPSNFFCCTHQLFLQNPLQDSSAFLQHACQLFSQQRSGVPSRSIIRWLYSSHQLLLQDPLAVSAGLIKSF